MNRFVFFCFVFCTGWAVIASAPQDEGCECDYCPDCPDWCFVCQEGQHWDGNGGRCGCMEDCTADELFICPGGEPCFCAPRESCGEGQEYCYIGEGQCMPGCEAGSTWDVETCECMPDEPAAETPVPDAEDDSEVTPPPAIDPFCDAAPVGSTLYTTPAVGRITVAPSGAYYACYGSERDPYVPSVRFDWAVYPCTVTMDGSTYTGSYADGWGGLEMQVTSCTTGDSLYLTRVRISGPGFATLSSKR